MGVGMFIHHIGTFFLLAASVLLIVVSISAPVVNDISLLKINLGNSNVGSEVTFGTFGYCLINAGGGSDRCSGSHVGYNPARFLESALNLDYNFSSGAEDTSKALTRVFVLHPVGAGLCFLAFLLSLGAGIIGSIFATIMAALAFIVTAVAIICDFVGLSLIRRRINDNTNYDAKYGIAIWLALAAAGATLIGAILVFLTCCAGRVKSKRDSRRSTKNWDNEPAGRF